MIAVLLRIALAILIYIGNITNFLSAVLIHTALTLVEAIESPDEVQVLDVNPETLRACHYRLRVLPDPNPSPPPIEVPAADPRNTAEPSEIAPIPFRYNLRAANPVIVRVPAAQPIPDIRGLESVQTEEQEHQRRTAAIRDEIIRGQQEDREREAAIARGRGT
jgi:hypothetical protein